VSVRGTQEHEIEYELLGYGKELDSETNPEPSDLVPRSRRWQYSRDEPPMKIPGNNRPDDGKDQRPRPGARDWQDGAEAIDCAQNEDRRRKFPQKFE
jgi:hypothetical protein